MVLLATVLAMSATSFLLTTERASAARVTPFECVAQPGKGTVCVGGVAGITYAGQVVGLDITDTQGVVCDAGYPVYVRLYNERTDRQLRSKTFGCPEVRGGYVRLWKNRTGHQVNTYMRIASYYQPRVKGYFRVRYP